MKKTLVISAHPNIEQSTANAYILNQLNESTSTTVRHLDAIYPDYKIDVAAEQNLLQEAEVVVFQFPLYWYSMPPVLKKWFDDVFTYGFAYGENGDKLKGKKVVLSVTTGGPEEAYSASGYNQVNVKDVLLPLIQTVKLTQMEFVDLNVSYAMVAMQHGEEAVLAKAKQHVQKLADQLSAL